MIAYKFLFSIFAIHFLLMSSTAEKCIKVTDEKWTTCLWQQGYITKEIYDWQKPAIPSCASLAVSTLIQLTAEIHFLANQKIETQAVLDCFGSCKVSHPLTVLSNIKVNCDQPRADWQIGLLFNTNIYPPYDGEAHACRFDRSMIRYLSPVCITYNYYRSGTSTQIDSIEQLMSMLEDGPFLAVLQVKSGFRIFEGEVYDQKRDSTSIEETRHALVIIGFRQHKDSKKLQIRVRNPWINQKTGLAWGDNGYAWIVIRNLFDMELNAFLANSTMFDKNYDE